MEPSWDNKIEILHFNMVRAIQSSYKSFNIDHGVFFKICWLVNICISFKFVLYINTATFFSASLFHSGIITRFRLIDFRIDNSSAIVCNKTSSSDKFAYGKTIFHFDIGNFSSSGGIVVCQRFAISLGMRISAVWQRSCIFILLHICFVGIIVFRWQDGFWWAKTCWRIFKKASMIAIWTW